jgi:chemotaxis protein MotB
MSRFDDEPQALAPAKRSWFTALIAIVAVGAAAGAGYSAWKLRQQYAGGRAELLRMRTDHADALRVQKARTQGVEEQLTTCKADLGTSTGETVELQKQVTALRDETAKSKEQLDDLKAVTERFQKMIDAGKLDISMRRGKMVVKLPEAILFPSGSAELSKGGLEALAEVAQILKGMRSRRFTIAGHTDNVKVAGGKFHSNWELSAARAVVVTEALVAKGVSARNLVAAGFGEHDPVATNTRKEGRQKNRRIEIILEPDLAHVPRAPVAVKEKPRRRGKR